MLLNRGSQPCPCRVRIDQSDSYYRLRFLTTRTLLSPISGTPLSNISTELVAWLVKIWFPGCAKELRHLSKLNTICSPTSVHIADSSLGDSISDFVCSFIVEQPKYIAVKDALERFCSTFLFDEQIKFHWEARVKEPDSLEKKLRRRSEDYATDVDNCRAIKDLVAGRIILPRWSTFQVVEEMIEEHFDLVSRTQHPKAPWKKKDTMQQRFRDYDGYHFYFTRKSSTVTDDLPDLVIEIQVMSPFMWAYQDLQHDLEYKALNGTPSEEESRALEYLRGIANLGEVAIKHFEDASWTRRGMPLTPARTLSLPTSSADHTDLETPLFRESLKSSARNVELLESLREFLEGKQSRLEAKSRQDVLAWISSTSAEVDHNRAREKLGEHYHDSGQWFKTYYNDWIASPDIGPLWVAGSVGTGKSSLM